MHLKIYVSQRLDGAYGPGPSRPRKREIKADRQRIGLRKTELFGLLIFWRGIIILMKRDLFLKINHIWFHDSPFQNRLYLCVTNLRHRSYTNQINFIKKSWNLFVLMPWFFLFSFLLFRFLFLFFSRKEIEFMTIVIFKRED